MICAPSRGVKGRNEGGLVNFWDLKEPFFDVNCHVNKVDKADDGRYTVL